MPSEYVMIRTIEDMSLNAWPSHQIQYYDGWLLRFSYFYTHRTNCVEQLGPSYIPTEEKVRFCEDAYKRWNTPCIFKLTPLINPAFDSYLEAKGYHTEHTTNVMLCDFNEAASFSVYDDVTLNDYIPSEWINGLFLLKKTTNPIHIQIVPSMYKAIPKETVSAMIKRDGKIIATGLGILDRDYIGIYAIHVDSAYRRQHLADHICRSLLAKGYEKGARHAYLQVVDGNTPAIDLYKTLGFSHMYSYWFRVK